MHAGEADHLAPAEARPQLREVGADHVGRHVAVHPGGQRREAVLEDDDLVVGSRGSRSARPSRDGQSGHWSAGGRKVRVCRCEAMVTHSSSRASNRSCERVATGGRSRGSTASRAGGGLAVEVEDLPAVGQSTAGADHGATLAPAVIFGPHRPRNHESSAPLPGAELSCDVAPKGFEPSLPP